MWHVSSRSGVATLRTAIHLLLTYLLAYNIFVQFLSLHRHGTSLHNTLSTCLRFVQLQSNFHQLLTMDTLQTLQSVDQHIYC